MAWRGVANHRSASAQDLSRRDPPGTTRSRGPEQVRRGASQGPLPRQGPAAGTMNAVHGRPPLAPRSRPVKLGATAPRVGEGTTATGKPTEAESDQTGRGAAHQPGATRHAGVARRRPQQRHKATAAIGCSEPAQRAQHTTKWGTGEGAKEAGPRRPQTAPTASGWSAPTARPKDGRSGAGERPVPDAPHPGKRRPPREPSSRPHNAHSQLARGRAVGSVTHPHAHSARTHGQWVAGPGRTPQGRAVGRGRGHNPGRPEPRQETFPTRCPRAAPTARKASSQERALWGW